MKKTTALLLALLLMLGTMSAFAEGPDGILEAYQQPREDIRNIIILIPDGMSPGGITPTPPATPAFGAPWTTPTWPRLPPACGASTWTN